MNIVPEIFMRSNPANIALVEAASEMTYGALEAAVNDAAVALCLCPLTKDFPAATRIGISLPNGIPHIIWSLAVLKLDWTLVPIPGELALPEKQALVVATAVAAVIASDQLPWLGNSLATQPLDDLQMHLLAPCGPTFPEPELRRMRAALIRFSSGTTGASKGVVLSHASLWQRVQTANKRLLIQTGDRVLWILPMAHHFAVSIVLYLLNGATTVLCDAHLGEELFQSLQAFRATVLYGSPYHFRLLAECQIGRPLPHLRLAVSTAAALDRATANNFRQRYDLPVTQGYGIIEVGLPTLNTTHAASQPLSVGSAQPSVKVRIAHPDDHGIGEVQLAGPGMFDAYLAPWALREDVLENGYFATGDLGWLDAEGLLHLTGRLKSVINVAGLKCFPEEVEAVLNQHPQVLESRVFAHPHPATGSVPVAEIVVQEPADSLVLADLRRHCREHLAAYKVPLKFVIVAAIAKTASGKIRRDA